MKKLTLLLASIMFVFSFGTTARAETTPPPINDNDAHNLCYLFRPYGTGILLHWWIITQRQVYCVDAIAQNQCVGYEVEYYSGGWHAVDYHQDYVNCYVG